jgi:hypothetical protein
MLNSLAVAPVAPAQSALTPPSEVAAPTPASASTDTSGSVEHTSPSLELDPAVGIVVIQYRNESGRVVLSIPSQSQLNAYAANPLTSLGGDTSKTVA